MESWQHELEEHTGHCDFENHHLRSRQGKTVCEALSWVMAYSIWRNINFRVFGKKVMTEPTLLQEIHWY